jgi:hypothetical protein
MQQVRPGGELTLLVAGTDVAVERLVVVGGVFGGRIHDRCSRNDALVASGAGSAEDRDRRALPRGSVTAHVSGSATPVVRCRRFVRIGYWPEGVPVRHADQRRGPDHVADPGTEKHRERAPAVMKPRASTTIPGAVSSAIHPHPNTAMDDTTRDAPRYCGSGASRVGAGGRTTSAVLAVGSGRSGHGWRISVVALCGLGASRGPWSTTRAAGDRMRLSVSS